MRRRIRHYILFLMLFLITIVLMACNKTKETGNQGPTTPSLIMTPTTEPTETPAPTETPIPARNVILAKSWFDECKIIDCEEYYFEVLLFK